MSRISIALSVYNGARFLTEQLNSLLVQTRLPEELVICDDCSTDSTVSIVENFARVAPFEVKLKVNKVNLGSCKNFEQAISLCSGDIIALCDQDDVWLSHKLAVSEELFLSDPEIGLVFGDAELVDENLRPFGKRLWDYTFPVGDRKLFSRGRALEVLLNYDVVTGAAMAFRARYRSIFLPIPKLELLIHDGWIALMIAAHAKVAFLPEPLIKYRQHPDQQLGIPALRNSGKKPSFDESIAAINKTISGLDSLKEELAGREGRFRDKGLSSETDELQLKMNLIYELLTARQHHLRDRSTHYQTRLDLPENRLRRIVPILRECYTGRYRRYSRSILSPMKDLTT
jgi:glycosyltransferase involved in cell wall biosynthesis